ncbi:MAG TPA: fumarylacetoacetate hydrolase family protein [Usitatibacter sp.]|nr:fumarylacetoacetate hydrolase family protein [Usitatibacter sp.]
MKNERREFLNAGAAIGAATVAACAGPMQAGAPPDPVLFAQGPVTIPIVGSNQRFQVRRIYCVGRNYAAHSREMGSDPTREPPFFFQKPSDAIQLVAPGLTIDHPYPPVTKNYHYEVELVVALGKGGRNIAKDTALELVYAYAVGLDMTRRDLQRMMGEQKKPWEVGKSFDHSAVISHLHPADKTGHLKAGRIWLKVNGEIKQDSNLDQMIWNVAEQISNLSQFYELHAGDIIYCGTPENVGPVVKGDLMTGHIDGIYEINAKVV